VAAALVVAIAVQPVGASLAVLLALAAGIGRQAQCRRYDVRSGRAPAERGG
jgi:hypothetical protein